MTPPLLFSFLRFVPSTRLVRTRLVHLVVVLALTAICLAPARAQFSDAAIPSLSEPAHFVTEPEPAAPSPDATASLFTPWLAIPLLSLAAAAGVIVAMRRAQLRADRSERAYTTLARKLRLTRTDRRTIEHLADTIKAKPVALLLSEHAFEVARRAAGKEHHEVDHTRQRLFL